jgi:hypothetical protein
MNDRSSPENIVTIPKPRGEAFALRQTVYNRDGTAPDLSGCTAIDLVAVREMEDKAADALYTKALGDFTISGADNNIATCNVARSEDNYPGTVYVLTRFTISATKSVITIFKLYNLNTRAV